MRLGFIKKNFELLNDENDRKLLKQRMEIRYQIGFVPILNYVEIFLFCHHPKMHYV